MMDSDPIPLTNHIPTLSEAVYDSEKFGPGLNNLSHNHVRPDTADAAVMAKAKRSARQHRPTSAQQFSRPGGQQHSVEEVLELTHSSDNIRSKQTKQTAKTNNYLRGMLRSNNKTGSAIGTINV